MERVGDRKGKMERYCSTGQSPQRAVAPTEEEEEEQEEEEEEGRPACSSATVYTKTPHPLP